MLVLMNDDEFAAIMTIADKIEAEQHGKTPPCLSQYQISFLFTVIVLLRLAYL